MPHFMRTSSSSVPAGELWMRESMGDISACFIDDRISSIVESWNSFRSGEFSFRDTQMRATCPYLALLVSTVRHIFQGAAKGSLLVTTLKKLATVGCEGLDVPKRYWRELRGDELGGEGIFGVEGIYVNQTIVDLSHCRIGCRWGVGVRARKR